MTALKGFTFINKYKDILCLKKLRYLFSCLAF